MASRMVIRPKQLRSAIKELLDHGRLHQDGDTYYFKDMARAEDIRMRRAAGGAASVKNPNVPHRKGILPMPPKGPPSSVSEGYPSEGSKDTLPSRARDARALALTSDSDSQGRGAGEGDETVEQVRTWLYEFMREEWPMPDIPVAVDVVTATNGASLDELQKFLLQLQRQGRKPEKSWAWFVPVIGTHFAGRAHGHQAAGWPQESAWMICAQCKARIPKGTPPCRCSNCHDSGIVFLVDRTIVGYTDLMENSMPCILCPAGEALKAEYAIFQAGRAGVKQAPHATTPTATAPVPAAAAAPECAACHGHGIFQGLDHCWNFCECPAGDRRRVEEPDVIEHTNQSVRKLQRLGRVPLKNRRPSTTT